MAAAPFKYFGQLCRCRKAPQYALGRCRRCYAKHYRTVNATKYKRMRRNHQLIADFGITIEQYETMRDQQRNLCKLCHRPEHRYRSLSVDHYHRTKRVRGLVCNDCNTKVLPRVDADPTFITRLSAYV